MTTTAASEVVLFDEACPPAYSTMPTPGARNRLAELTVLARMLGLELMPHQRHILAVLTEQFDDGRPRYRDVTMTLPRQASKTTLLALMAFDRMLRWGRPQQVLYVAQALTDAVAVWRAGPWQMLVDAGFDREAGMRFYKGLSDSKISCANGSVLRLITGGRRTSGHGSTLGLAIYDEAFAAVDSRVEQSVMPTLRTVRDAQFVVASTAGDMSSTYLKRRVDDGRAMIEAGRSDGRVAYIEWSAPEHADPYDEAVWLKAIPNIGRNVELDDLRIEAAQQPEADWRRAGLNQWVTTAAEPVVNEAHWRACKTRLLKPSGGVVVGLDCTPDRASGSLVVCDSTGIAEVIAARPGVDWLVPAARHVVTRNSDVVGVALLGGASAATVFIDPLREAGVPHVVVTRPDYVVATGMFVDAVAARTVRVFESEFYSRLAVAVKGAVKQGKDGFIWSRLDVSIDICPLVALTLAHWAARRAKVESLRPPSVVDLDAESKDADVEAWLETIAPTEAG